MTIKEIKHGSVVELRDGTRGILAGDIIIFKHGYILTDIYDNETMRYDSPPIPQYDIMKVYLMDWSDGYDILNRENLEVQKLVYARKD